MGAQVYMGTMDGHVGDKRGSGFFIKQRHTGLV